MKKSHPGEEQHKLGMCGSDFLCLAHPLVSNKKDAEYSEGIWDLHLELLWALSLFLCMGFDGECFQLNLNYVAGQPSSRAN